MEMEIMNSFSDEATWPASVRGRQKQKCRYCQHSYKKHEHLVRHERTHTGQRPFACGVCGKSFARGDTLLRHKKLHVGATLVDPDTQLDTSSRNDEDLQMPSGSQEEDTSGTSQIHHLTPAHAPDGALDSEPSGITPLGFENVPFLTDTDDFLQQLLNFPQGWPMPMSAGMSPASLGDNYRAVPNLRDDGQHLEHAEETSPPAVLKMNAIIADMSSSVSEEIRSKNINSPFLDACLYLFFARFNPTFPIMHEATFLLKDCGPFLLLNMVAIGSLFIGTSDAVGKGEFLWRLAQTAAATSWGVVFEGKSSVDGSHGAQIVTTALLGQVYAMSSRSERLRTTSQSLHGLPFSWARQFGMYDLGGLSVGDVPEIGARHAEKMKKWKTWVLFEIQRRTVLGLYIIDGQLARYSGGVPIGRHVTNRLPFSSRESIFNAKTVDDWIFEMNQHWVGPSTFREVFVSLFDVQAQQVPFLTSQFTIHVVLEGMQGLLSENRDADGTAFGIPSRSQIISAMLRFRHNYLEITPTSLDSLDLLLRWHALCLDLAIDAVLLCRKLCAHHGVKQNIFFNGRASTSTIDLDEWSCSVDARRALLHAIAIQDIAERLPMGRAQATHVPASIFAAATVYSALSTVRQVTVAAPESIDWDEVWDCDDHNMLGHANTVNLSDGKAFVWGNPRSDAKAKSRNLRYSLLTLQSILRNVSSQWGVSHAMLNVLQSWTSPAV